MDIVITLPQTLWKKIVSGEKSIELRKNFPKMFRVNSDKIYVILKGTTRVAGYFHVSSFEYFYAESISDFDPIIDKISIPKQWIINYVGYSSAVYLWHIRNVHCFVKLINRRSVWNLKTNPQSYVYVN